MSPKYKNKLMLYVLDVNESPELAEERANEFCERFDNLGKYEQMCISLLVETNDWDAAFKEVGL